MKRYATLLTTVPLLLLTACVPYYVDYPGTFEPTPSVVVAPVLPPLVVLETRPYYVYSGFYYYWDDHRDLWLYSRYRRGPWYRLPRSHYPERFRHKGKWHTGRGRGRDHDRGRGSGR